MKFRDNQKIIIILDGFEILSFVWPKGVGHKITHIALNRVDLGNNVNKEFLDNLRLTSVQSLDLSHSPKPAGILMTDPTIWDDLHDLEFIDFRGCNLTSLGGLKVC